MGFVVRSLGIAVRFKLQERKSTAFCTVKVLIPRTTSWNLAAPTQTIALEGVLWMRTSSDTFFW
jgi:hypothetical protein